MFCIVCKIPQSYVNVTDCHLYAGTHLLLKTKTNKNALGGYTCHFTVEENNLFHHLEKSISREVSCQTEPHFLRSAKYTIPGIQLIKPPNVTVFPSVISENETVNISCWSSHPVTSCSFHLDGIEAALHSQPQSAQSCQLSFTGTKLQEWAQQLLPVELKVKCSFNTSRTGEAETSPLSEPTSVTVRNNSLSTDLPYSDPTIAPHSDHWYSENYATTTPGTRPSDALSESAGLSFIVPTTYISGTTSTVPVRLNNKTDTGTSGINPKTPVPSSSATAWIMTIIVSSTLGVFIMGMVIICLCNRKLTFQSKVGSRMETNKSNVTMEQMGSHPPVGSESAGVYSMITSVALYSTSGSGDKEESDNDIYHLYCTIPDSCQ
ncbi:uncharacterized protein LOC114780167 isoform X2 [Denticeps clupeoides]|nr:uncharacterized protein LOC114780167 isoform X2 [Denticeps clupeoides]